MVLTVIYVLAPLLAFRPLQHWLFGLHIAVVAAVSWARFPSLDYALWHSYYLPFLAALHFIVITLVTFGAYGWDKYQARRGGWRVPEATLHALAFIGGSLGAWAGSRFFRHKTIKGSFRKMFTLVVALQVLLALVIIWVSQW